MLFRVNTYEIPESKAGKKKPEVVNKRVTYITLEPIMKQTIVKRKVEIPSHTERLT